MALKGELKNVEGSPPFFMEPTLSMRGFDTSRYRDLPSGRKVQSSGAGKAINLGVDLAFSGSESAVYIRAGEAF